MEISGELSVTFSVRNAGDLQRIMVICQEFDGQTILQPEAPRAQKKGLTPSTSKEETYKKILAGLKMAFPKGFGMAEAAAHVQTKLGYKRTSTRNAISWARKKGHLLKKGYGYFYTDVLQERVAAQMPTIESEAPHQQEPIPQEVSSV